MRGGQRALQTAREREAAICGYFPDGRTRAVAKRARARNRRDAGRWRLRCSHPGPRSTSPALHGWSGLGHSIAGIVLGATIFGLLYALGGMGMSDLKLCAAIGAWIGPEQLIFALVLNGHDRRPDGSTDTHQARWDSTTRTSRRHKPSLLRGVCRATTRLCATRRTQPHRSLPGIRVWRRLCARWHEPQRVCPHSPKRRDVFRYFAEYFR